MFIPPGCPHLLSPDLQEDGDDQSEDTAGWEGKIQARNMQYKEYRRYGDG